MNIPRTHFRRGFTLTELLISVGLALLVLYGVNTVFKATADTIGTGQALGEANRTMRAVESNLASDFNPQQAAAGGEVPGTGIVPLVADATTTYGHAQPAIAIRSQRIYAFLNKADQDANNGNPAAMWDPTESGTYSPVSPDFISLRNHRIDTLSFFTGGKTGAPGAEVGSFRRQTGQILNGRETLVTSLSKPAQHAWVWYGHARQPVAPDSTDLTPTNYAYPALGDATTNPNNYYAADWSLARKAILIVERDKAAVLTPPNGYVFDGNGGLMYFYRGSALPADPGLMPIGFGSIAAYSPDGLHANDVAAIGDSQYIQSGIYDVAAMTDGMGVALPIPNGLYEKFAAQVDASWLQLVEDGAGNAYRFNANPKVGAPLIPTTGQLAPSFKSALTSSILAPGCVQFVVEFAGDFDGTAGTDVRLDDPDGAGPLGPVSSIQWYGLPRDSRGLGIDVNTVAALTGGAKAFERASATDVYNCVWGPTNFADVTQRPSLIRITVSIADTNNRLQDGMTREFIYRVR